MKKRLSRIRYLLLGALGILVCYMLTSVYLTACMLKGRRVNMEQIAEGVIHFNDSQGRLPRSLAELGFNNFLPKRSDMYASPLRHGRFFLLPIVGFTNMEYEMLFSETNVIVRYQPRDRAVCAWVLRSESLQHLDLAIGPNEHGMKVSTPKRISRDEFRRDYLEQ